jgi:hypothetical protein
MVFVDMVFVDKLVVSPAVPFLSFIKYDRREVQ